MKFYYNGKLVRSSKTHEYKYAVVREKEDGKLIVWGCSATRSGAEKMFQDMLKRYRSEECRETRELYKLVALDCR